MAETIDYDVKLRDSMSLYRRMVASALRARFPSCVLPLVTPHLRGECWLFFR
jgi:hypothetical protein